MRLLAVLFALSFATGDRAAEPQVHGGWKAGDKPAEQVWEFSSGALKKR